MQRFHICNASAVRHATVAALQSLKDSEIYSMVIVFAFLTGLEQYSQILAPFIDA
jgi:hypothetical protein